MYVLASCRNLTPRLTLGVVRAVTPSFGTYTAQSAALSGSLRHSHSRLAEFAEEVAFFGGEETEKEIIEKEYVTLVRHEEKVMARRWWYSCAEEGIMKWLWGSFGVSITLSCTHVTKVDKARSLCHPGFLQASWSLQYRPWWSHRRFVQHQFFVLFSTNYSSRFCHQSKTFAILIWYVTLCSFE